MSRVLAVARSAAYTFTKPTCEAITLVVGLGVEGDVHSGVTVKHRSRMKQDPSIPNLRQVHLNEPKTRDQHWVIKESMCVVMFKPYLMSWVGSPDCLQ